MRYLFILLTVSCLIACKTNKETVSEEVIEVEEVANTKNPPKPVVVVRKGLHDGENSDCYNDRKSLNAISSVSGEVVMAAGMYMLQSYDTNTRYQPCKLPDAMQKEGTAVIFSGIIKEIFPGERRAGTPFVLTNINITM